MRIIFDLDRTLFDTDKFKQDLAKALAPFGVSDKVFFKTSSEVMFRQPGQSDYDYLFHVKSLKSYCGWSDTEAAKAKKSLRQVMANGKNYLLPYAAEMLHNLKTAGHTLILWTWGNHALHTRKIRSSGIQKYFSRIEITPLDKTLVLRDFFTTISERHDDLIFISDSLKELKAILAYSPKVKVILKVRPDRLEEAREARKLKIPAFKDLRQIGRFIQSLY